MPGEPLTIVLPIHNGEGYLSRAVHDLLEVAETIPSGMEIVVVDDGSADETYETACELARTYPQVKVLRQTTRRGLAAAIELVGDRIAPRQVIVHDGVSAITASQLQRMLEHSVFGNASQKEAAALDAATANSMASRRFGSIRALHSSMEDAHRNITGFYWMQIKQRPMPRRRSLKSMGAPAAGAPIGPSGAFLPVASIPSSPSPAR